MFLYLRCLFFCGLAITLVRSDLTAPSQGNQLEAPTVRIDPILRKALLKALSNLEKESDELDDKTGTTENLFASTTESDELLEESTTADRLKAPKVQYTAFTFDRNSSDSGNNDNTIYKTIIVPKTTLSPPKEKPIIVFSDPDPLKEEDIQIETVQLARSVSTNIQANDIQEGSKISDKVLALSKNALTSTSAPITTTTAQSTPPPTTTTTTEAPVTNSDGVNIEKVNDVQIHQAPLVAAFTVQQDAQGLPKSVMPIFKQLIDPVGSQLAKQPLRVPQQGPINFAVNPYQFALEQNQRELEQRIHFLQAQQRHQEQIFRQQQQQLFFEQRFRAEEEQRVRQRYEQDQRFRLQSFQQQQQQQPSFNQFPQRTPPSSIHPGTVQVIPSVSLQNNNNNGLPFDQQLPVRESGTFKISSDQQLPLLQQANFNPKEQSSSSLPGPLQLQPQLQLPQRPFIPFNNQVSIVPSVSAQLKNNNIEPGLFPPFEGNQQPLTRVFRHENNPVSFEQQKSQQIFGPPHANAQNLHQLLFQSGFGGRSNEDLNIITRVLALNHGIHTPLTGNFIGGGGGNGQQRNNIL